MVIGEPSPCPCLNLWAFLVIFSLPVLLRKEDERAAQWCWTAHHCETTMAIYIALSSYSSLLEAALRKWRVSKLNQEIRSLSGQSGTHPTKYWNPHSAAVVYSTRRGLYFSQNMFKSLKNLAQQNSISHFVTSAITTRSSFSDPVWGCQSRAKYSWI